MRMGTLAAGLAVGYVLGARAGREKYDRIAAAARRVSAGPGVAPAEPERIAPVADPVTPASTGETPRRQRNRRPKAARTAGVANGKAATTGDSLPLEAAEADVAEQRMPVAGPSGDPAGAAVPLESNAADVSEQRRS